MPFEYTGPLIFPITLFRNLLSASPAFQVWTGTATPGEAHNKTWPMLIGPTEVPNFAGVSLGREWESVSIAGGTEETWRDGGAVDILFVGSISDRTNVPQLQQELTAFLESLNGIMLDLRRIAVEGQFGYVMLKRLSLSEEMALAPEETDVDFVSVVLSVSYGF